MHRQVCSPCGTRRPVAHWRDQRLLLSSTGQRDEEAPDLASNKQRTQPLAVSNFLRFCSNAVSSRLPQIREPRDPSVLAGWEESGPSRFRPVNGHRESGLRAEETTTATRPPKRQKTSQGAADELCHQETSPLHMLTDVAVREHAEPQSAGVVPSPGQHDVAAVSPLDSPLGESDVGVLSLRDVENAASPQPSVSG